MKISDAPAHVVDLVSKAEAIIESRELQKPAEWDMTAFSRYRLLELLGVDPVTPYVGVADVSPAALLEEATTAAEELTVSVELVAWRRSLVQALGCALADVRMVSGACDV
ncbi:hypothetical protein OHA18_41325 [Kribbella sp. NBC_00709]|uniref:hypothetical protein n=1 Tax=Kribbella sp. NBC_00709 TaxID=2975972 RepID=UPI002E288F54|nr:hypothetical protein [Kribbella sp. NBC_00709]